MTFKRVTNPLTGDATHFGGIDINKFSDYLGGTDISGSETVNIATATNFLAPTTFYQHEFVDAATWTIYKQGSNYKAFNGYLGYSPTSAVNTSLNSVWNYITTDSTNFNQGIPDATTTGGSIVFAKGKYIFTETPWPNAITDDWAGDFGIHVLGQGPVATWIEFTPTTQKDAGFELKDIQHSSIRNMFVRVNNFVTNVIKINANTTSTQNTQIADLYINNANSVPVSGQHGILINADSTNDTFFTNIHDIYMRFIHHGIETTGTSGGNTAFRIRNIVFWLAEYGITLHSKAILCNISDIMGQFNSSWGLYVISLGTDVIYTNIANVWSDGTAKAGATTILLNAGVGHSQISNVINNHGIGTPTILDYSGKPTNQFSNIGGFGSPNRLGRARNGVFAGTSAAGGSGMFAPPGLQEIAATSIGQGFDTAEGAHWAFNTAATSGTQSGTRGIGHLCTRALGARFYARFSLVNLTDSRIYIGLTNEKAADPTVGDDPFPSNKASIGIALRVADTNFQVFRNDSTGATNFSDAVSDYPGTTAIAESTSIHELWIQADEINTRWLISLDSSPPQIFTTEIPAANDLLSVVAVVQTNAAVAKRLNLYYMELRSRN